MSETCDCKGEFHVCPPPFDTEPEVDPPNE